MNRRQFLCTTAMACGSVFFSHATPKALRSYLAEGTFLGTVDFIGEGPALLETPIGVELDKRMYADLSRIGSKRTGLSISEFYIRTGASELLPSQKNWQVKVGGLVEKPITLVPEELRAESRNMGHHLMECAGNNRLTRFGLLSEADWTGVPFSEIATRVKPEPGAPRVLVSGFDRYATESRTSIPGASWIFSLEDLHSARAFLATGMNGAPLSRDHGAPVRLVVPGWYGCACTKWVQAIEFVKDDVAASLQMQEFAARTLQDGIPQFARDFSPAIIDQAAMPIRVEKWRIAGEIEYRMLGILWGGSQLVKTLKIRFNPEEEFVTVDSFRQTANDPWSIWTHIWRPPAPDTYQIRLTITEPPVRARKLDAGYYDRMVEITEV